MVPDATTPPAGGCERRHRGCGERERGRGVLTPRSARVFQTAVYGPHAARKRHPRVALRHVASPGAAARGKSRASRTDTPTGCRPRLPTFAMSSRPARASSRARNQTSRSLFSGGKRRVLPTRSLVPRPPQARPRPLDRRPGRRQRRRRRGRRRLPRRVRPARRRVQDGFDILDEHFGGQGTGITGTIVFQAEQGVDDPEVQAAMEDAVRRGRRRSTTSSGSRAPTRRAASSRSLRRATGAGRSPTPTSSCPRTSTSPGPPRSATRSSTSVPEIDGLRVELGGFIFAEFEEPSSELVRPRLRHRHPDRRLRLGAGHGPARSASPCSASASARRSSRCSATSSTVPDFATVPRRHDRPRRRHRLRAAHRHPLPGAAPRRPRRPRVDRASRSTPPAGRSLFAGATVVISLLGMLLMGVGFVSGLGRQRRARRSPSRSSRRSPCCPRCSASPATEIELTRWRGLIAAGLVAVGLVGRRAQDPAAASSAFPLAVVVLIAGLLRRRRCKREVPAPAAEAAARDRRLPVEPGHPAPAVAGRDRRHRRAARAGHPGARPAARASPTRATSPRTPPPSRPTTCSSRASARASTARSTSWPRCPTGTEQVDALGAVTDAVAADPGVAFVLGRRARTTRTNPTAVLLERRAHHRPAGRGDHRARQPPARRRAARRSRRPTGADVARHRHVAANVDFSDYLAERMPYLLRRRARAVVPAADGRVPVAARAAQGRDHEPAVDRRRLRRRRRPVPVGLAQRPHRRAARPRSSRGCR